MIGTKLQMINLTLFSNTSTDIAMANNFVAKSPTPPSVVTLALQNGMEYHYVNVCVSSDNDALTLCKNLVNFGPLTPDITRLIYIFLYDSA